MGTKRELAGAVADVLAACPVGPMLDVFAGMCSVGEAVGLSRQVWTNDAQVFASEVGAALFTSERQPLKSQAVADLYHDRFSEALSRSIAVWDECLVIEQAVLDATNFEHFERARGSLRTAIEAQQTQGRRPWPCLFSIQYADTFFGLRQALEIDAVVEAVRGSMPSSVMSELQRWLMIALGRTMLRVSTTTGHFAQFLTPKVSSFRNFQRQRRRRIWTEWLESNDELEPVGDERWRRYNRAFNEDTLLLLPKLAREQDRPRVVYADPPYTNDQYSRYYHVLETLVLYDYPVVSNAGLYRHGRFSTDFSLKSRSVIALENLINGVSNMGADLVLSYPTNGLAHSKGVEIDELMRRRFRNVEVCHAISHDHSTFGASKGSVKAAVTEKIYLGRS